jgi:protease IV
MTKEQVDAIGQGRVWTGRDALEIGLVDQLGGLEDAIELAANMANLDKYRIKNLPIQKNPLEVILEELNSQARTSILKNELGENYNYYMEMKSIINTEDIQMRMPMQFEIY